MVDVVRKVLSMERKCVILVISGSKRVTTYDPRNRDDGDYTWKQDRVQLMEYRVDSRNLYHLNSDTRNLYHLFSEREDKALRHLLSM